ncbi:ankyrin repeat-containing domain protein [Blakeslea trispora]|nr:ankyrin repeat-containing domain protein [Blakeslea trispora]
MQKYIKTIETEDVSTVDQNELKQVLYEKDEHGDTLLHFASRAHNLPAVRLLVDLGADREAMNEHGRRPIHEAIDSVECLSYLIKTCGVDTNAMKRGDWTPIMIAATKGHMDILRLLVESGSLLKRTTRDGRTPLYLAVQEGHLEASKFLTDQYPDAITQATNSGRLPIQAAAALSHTDKAFELTNYLLSHATVSLSTLLSHRDNSGRNVVLDAVVAQNLPLLEYLLLEANADANDSDSLGRRMVHHAAMMGHLDVLEALNKWNAISDWNIVDDWDHWTPLMHAARQGHEQVVEYLINTMHVDSTIKDKQQRTAKDIASLWQHTTVVKLLS